MVTKNVKTRMPENERQGLHGNYYYILVERWKLLEKVQISARHTPDKWAFA